MVSEGHGSGWASLAPKSGGPRVEGGRFPWLFIRPTAALAFTSLESLCIMSAEVSEAAQPSTVDSALLAKLQSYPLVTSAFDYYFSIKSSSSLATVRFSRPRA